MGVPGGKLARRKLTDRRLSYRGGSVYEIVIQIRFHHFARAMKLGSYERSGFVTCKSLELSSYENCPEYGLRSGYMLGDGEALAK